jgi:hypothetical protein
MTMRRGGRDVLRWLLLAVIAWIKPPRASARNAREAPDPSEDQPRARVPTLPGAGAEPPGETTAAERRDSDRQAVERGENEGMIASHP